MLVVISSCNWLAVIMSWMSTYHSVFHIYIYGDTFLSNGKMDRSMPRKLFWTRRWTVKKINEVG